MMRFGGSSRGMKKRRPSSVNRIDLPDFIPFECIEPIQSHPEHYRNPNYHDPVTFQDSKKANNQKHNNRISEERHHTNRREASDRQKRKHSPITHHPSSNQSTKYRSKSPKNLKVIANVANRRKQNASFSDFGQHSSHYEMYDESRPRHSPIVYDLNDQQKHSMNESTTNPVHIPSTSNQQILVPETSNKRSKDLDNITVQLKCRTYDEIPPNNVQHVQQYDKEEIEILERLQTLEKDKKQLLGHCNGLRDTIDQYYREISKLEALVHTFSEEIEILKRRIYK